MKERLDIVLVDRKLVETRTKAKAIIMAGDVLVNGEKIDKAGTMIDINSMIDIKEKSEFVSRGGYKLKRAIEIFNINLNGKLCLDVGASTGGFSDCMLKNNATHVIAIDVGYGQYDYALRCDNRVSCLERTNIRYVKSEDLEYLADFTAIDVSFISLKKIIENVRNLMKDDFEIVCLIKPQFEAGREKVGKNGVIKDKLIHKEVIFDILNFLKSKDFYIHGLDYSPIKGPKGNIEFLIYLKSDKFIKSSYNDEIITKIIDDAWIGAK